MRQEVSRLLRPSPPLQLQTASDILRGEWTPTKEDPEKENNVRTWGAGAGGRGRKARMALSVSEGLKTNNCVAVCMLLYQHCWALKS